MICDDFKAFPQIGKLLGVDWGEKRIGLAVSTPDHDFVFPRPHIINSQFALRDLVAGESIVGIVVGLPLRLDGSESETTVRVRAFAAELSAETDVPIILFDESLTSAEAEENLGDNASDIDSESARILLENAIAFMSRS